MHASIRELLNGFHPIVLGSELGMSPAEFAGQLTPVRFESNGNNGGTTDNAGGHYRTHANRARAKNGKTGASRAVERRENCARTCLNTAAERAQHGQRDIVADFD